MAVKDRTTKMANISATPRELDFVSRFGMNFEGLRELLGVSNIVKVAPGVLLKARRGLVSLQTSPNEGDEIPYSQAAVEEISIGEITLQKYAKGTTGEAVQRYGYDVAIGKTDDAFLMELQKKIESDLYAFVNEGELTHIATTWQMGLAMANGLARDAFKRMHLNASGIVGFVNILDAYAYLGGANVSIQNAFGIDYIRDFMGYRVIFLLPGEDVPRNKIIATAIENFIIAAIDPASDDFARAGLEFVTDGEENLVGFHTEARYSHLVSECYALMGVRAYAEYVDGVAVVTIEASGSKGSLTVASVAGDEIGDTKLSVSEDLGQGCYLVYKAASGTAPTAPDYLAIPDATWAKFEEGENVAITNGYKVQVLECNGSGQTIAAGNATVVAKTS